MNFGPACRRTRSIRRSAADEWEADDSDNRSHARQERDCQALAERGVGSQPPPLFDLYCDGLAYVKEEFWPTLFGPSDPN